MNLVSGLAAALIGLALAVLAAAAVATALIAARVEARYPPAGRFVEVAGGRLAVIEDGPAEGARGTIVLLHGASASGIEPMEGIGRRLAAKGFRVLAFDRPGFGWSDRLAGAAAATPAFQGRAIHEALDRLGVGRTLLFGHSWSGALALAMALDRPERVAGLVLAAPVALPFPPRPLPWWARIGLHPPVLWLLTRTVAVPLGLSYLPKAAHGVFAPQAMTEGYVETARAGLILRPGAALANIQDLVGLPAALAELAPRYGGLAVPTLIVGGTDDPVVRTGVQAGPLAQTIPGARLVELPGIGHMLHYVAADALVTEIDAFAAPLGR